MAKRFVSNKDETARLFENDFLEKFTHVHFTVPLFIYVPVILFLLYHTAAKLPITMAAAAGMFVFGFFAWTLTEYVLHRFVFHYEPKTKLGRDIHFLFHGIHHDYPNDSTRLVMPPVVSIPLAFLFGSLFWLVFGPNYFPTMFAGYLVGYLCYDMIHYATHHFSLKSRAGLWLRQHHMRHHFQNEHRGYGVSTPLWDYVFGTMPDEKQKTPAAKSGFSESLN
ncbi:fatty acid hydroxylase [candidate division KSB1 bacterium]|nr:MAG: fatty acid hydroxylase [candidate division KSB1 bacterium]MBC6947064.1 fatty acid hydroxylase [candidate division KSB1 bacterium]MCE7944822.1 fatty acid hydroxylase [Chlorobi bacterium CHB1]